MANFGAGGTSGGIGKFFIGLFMFVVGAYLLLNNIFVTNSYSFMSPFYHVGGFGISSGILMIPFMIGIAMIFYNSKNIIGWILGLGAIVLIVVGVIVSVRFQLNNLSAFEFFLIIVLMVGGLGLWLSSLRPHQKA